MTPILHSIRLLLAGMIAFGLIAWFHWQEGYWIVLSALLGLQFAPLIVWRQKAALLLLSGLVIAAMAVGAQFVSSSVLAVSLFLFVTTFLTVYLGMLYALIWGMAFLANFFATTSAGVLFPEAYLQRFGCIVVGFLLAALLQAVFFPDLLKGGARRGIQDCLTTLSKLSEALFSCFLSRVYPEKKYVFDKALHELRTNFLYAMTEVRAYEKRLSDPLYSEALHEIEHIYEILLSLGCLLHRVEDHTTFQVVNAELLALATSITHHFDVMRGMIRIPSRTSFVDDSLLEAIFQLEEVQHSALQVVASEPIVFLFFQHDLNALKEALEKLAETLQKWMAAK